jgi:uncharacterized membrane protein
VYGRRVPVILGVVQFLHVFCAIAWFGSVLVLRNSLWPATAQLDSAHQARMQTLIRTGRVPGFVLIFSAGTVVFGALRGALAGAFERLTEPYGITFIVSLVIGSAMFAWSVLPLPESLRGSVFDRLYVAGFPAMLALMVAMRFGY